MVCVDANVTGIIGDDGSGARPYACSELIEFCDNNHTLSNRITRICPISCGLPACAGINATEAAMEARSPPPPPVSTRAPGAWQALTIACVLTALGLLVALTTLFWPRAGCREGLRGLARDGVCASFAAAARVLDGREREPR